HVGNLELVKRVEPSRIGQAQHHADAAPMADDHRRQVTDLVDLGQRLRDPLLLLEQRLSARKAELRPGASPGRIEVGLDRLYVGERVALPAAAIALPQTPVGLCLQADPGAYDLRCLAGSAEV